MNSNEAWATDNDVPTPEKVPQPVGYRILLRPRGVEEKTKGGIIIPDTAKEKPQKGKVYAVGIGKKKELLTVKVNDFVLYGKYSGTEITLKGEDYLIMKESDIYAVIL
jgi:chaperonin GroES